ncbi:hypothetical protein RAS12_21295 [Achromobacter seleniivolatilans]|uniref:Uncharacterized protein n=1 Tax=Achromobacter seleniivolatilans TaxID=3047478 RepID=A0ABY9LXQ7_9BURK|nr:hypothetical protein [Achromobacter sp. R39]WMD19143.1 hypothetical protein RAS12_21295 [Achromobacter sp. R39]
MVVVWAYESFNAHLAFIDQSGGFLLSVKNSTMRNVITFLVDFLCEREKLASLFQRFRLVMLPERLDQLINFPTKAIRPLEQAIDERLIEASSLLEFTSIKGVRLQFRSSDAAKL